MIAVIKDVKMIEGLLIDFQENPRNLFLILIINLFNLVILNLVILFLIDLLVVIHKITIRINHKIFHKVNKMNKMNKNIKIWVLILEDVRRLIIISILIIEKMVRVLLALCFLQIIS